MVERPSDERLKTVRFCPPQLIDAWLNGTATVSKIAIMGVQISPHLFESMKGSQSQ